MSTHLTELTEQVRNVSSFIPVVRQELAKVLVGQDKLVDALLLAILADGHILLEGLPGLAKTTAISTLGKVMDLSFQRIQFTPDLLPADIIGTQIYQPKTGEMTVKKGPIFHQLILADEINRAPAKVQSALLEAMQEKQVTIGETTFTLQQPFLVLATQNPIEQEGTYPLPEAQVDRFMFKASIAYPKFIEEKEIMLRMSKKFTPTLNKVINASHIVQARETIDHVYVDDKIHDYILNIIFATRDPEKYQLGNIKHLIEVGASPRASINILKAVKAYAFMNSRAYVSPQDVKQISPLVLRHRIHLSYEAEAENVNSDQIVQKIFDRVDVP